jgi:probable HAF family extracellular repeat protein
VSFLSGGVDDREATPADSSGAFAYRDGRFIPLGGVPGAGLVGHVAIDDRGRSVGSYVDAGVTPGPDGSVPAGSVHGFIKDSRGRVTAVDVPSAAATFVLGVNDSGQVAGSYFDSYPPSPGDVHGFVGDPDGDITTIDLPGATNTAVTDINNRGQVVGQYVDDEGDTMGFVRDQRGRITTIDASGQAQVGEILALNDRGQVVGEIIDPDSRHGFVWEHGRLRRFDVPGASSTAALGINSRGQISGGSTDADGQQHGFVLQRGRYTTIDAPGRTVTNAWGINDHGDIVIPDLGSGRTPGT